MVSVLPVSCVRPYAGTGMIEVEARRKFYDLHAARSSAITTEAMSRLVELYVIEAEIDGKPPDRRLVSR